MHCTFLIDYMKYNSVNVSKGGILTCSMPVLVHPDPSEKATFSLLNTDPVKEGDTVTMKCETDGNPQPEFDFTKDVSVCASCAYCVCTVCLRENQQHTCPSIFRTNPSMVKEVSWFWNLSSAPTTVCTSARPQISITWMLTWLELSPSLSTVSEQKTRTHAHTQLQN